MGRCLWHAMSVISRFARPVWSLNSRREEKSASDVVLAMTVEFEFQPEFYFSQKIDYLKDKIQPSFVKECRAVKRDYEEFKVKINALVAKAQKTPEEGWTMQDGTPWRGNNTCDHPGMFQVFLGNTGAHDTEGSELPCLVYVSREKRPGYQHHKKAGAENALVRVSAVLTNALYILNLDCDHYLNNSKAIHKAMCYLMDPIVGRDVWLCDMRTRTQFSLM